MRGISGVTDFYLVASGSSPPHLKAMGEEIRHALKKKGVLCYRRSGNPEGGWLALDFIDVVIHIFSQESRRYYAIEDLWPEAPRVK